jgi:FlaA1/EpsC-like NDP-sugar epimerase
LAIRGTVKPSVSTIPRAAERSDEPPPARPTTPSRPRLIERVWANVVRSIGRMRGRHLLVLDGIGIVLAAYLALAFRFDTGNVIPAVTTFAPVIILLLVVRVVTNVRGGLYNRAWRFASVPELQRIVTAGLAGTIVAASIAYGWATISGNDLLDAFPRSFWAAELLATLAVLGGVRLAIRAATDWRPGSAGVTHARRPTLLYGAGRTGVMLAHSALRTRDAGVLPVGFLDDDPDLAGRLIDNLPIFGGLDSLDRAIAATRAEVLLITMPEASGKSIRRVVDAAMASGLDVRTVPSMNDLLDGTVDAYRVRKVQVEDLLRRPTATEHAEAVRGIIEDRTIVITGAGGSIGSELARQVYSLRPRRLILVDRAESALYLVRRELESRAARGQAGGELRAHLANVASRAVMLRLMLEEKPDVIFHAAAYKHVPVMEEHPSDAVHVNIGGTQSVLDAAEAAGVPRFVLVSTDKAVRPSSVMGASKRIAELLVAEAATRTGRAYASVRFGNVLGSTGSVVPIFQDQLEKSEPLTITHPEMTRFFMTIPEASWLILDAAALATCGDLFVLDMGEPIRIVDLANDLVRLAGRDPETQPIDIVGLRQGEKLHEELFYKAERVQPTAVPKVLRADPKAPPSTVREDAHDLVAQATGEREAELRDALLAYARSADDRAAPAADTDEEPKGFEDERKGFETTELPDDADAARSPQAVG